MNRKNILLAGGVAALGLGLIALPGRSTSVQNAQHNVQEAVPPVAPAPPNVRTHVRIMQTPQGGVVVGGPEAEGDGDGNVAFAFDDEGGSWLGVETQEVTAEKAEGTETPPRRAWSSDRQSAGGQPGGEGRLLKDDDVIMEINGQRVEGTVQFRRMIHETPAGRTLQLTVSRNGRSVKQCM